MQVVRLVDLLAVDVDVDDLVAHTTDEQGLALLHVDLVHLVLPDGELVTTYPPEAEEMATVYDLGTVDPDTHQAPDLVPAHVEDVTLLGADVDLIANIPLVRCLHGSLLA
jgi:hypothetical protein